MHYQWRYNSILQPCKNIQVERSRAPSPSRQIDSTWEPAGGCGGLTGPHIRYLAYPTASCRWDTSSERGGPPSTGPVMRRPGAVRTRILGRRNDGPPSNCDNSFHA